MRSSERILAWLIEELERLPGHFETGVVSQGLKEGYARCAFALSTTRAP